MSHLSQNDSNQARFHSLTGLHDTTTDAKNDDNNYKRKTSTTMIAVTMMTTPTTTMSAMMTLTYHDDDEKEEGYHSPVHMDIIDNHSPGPLCVSQSQWPHKFHLWASMLSFFLI